MSKTQALQRFWQQLRTLDQDNLASASKPVLLAMMGLVILIVLIFGWLIVISPLLDRLHAKRTQEQMLLQTYQSAYQQASSLPAYQAWQNTQNDSLATRLGVLPKSAAMTDLIGKIKQSADTHGVQMIKISMLPMSQQAMYTERPIAISVRGDYHDIGRWLVSLARHDEPITMHEYDLQADGRAVILSITIKTYQMAKQLSFEQNDTNDGEQVGRGVL